MTKVKICGITNLGDALLAVRFGADALGFNFYEKSPRYITPSAARGIISEVGQMLLTVGVFVNEETYTVAECVDHAGLDAVQLHGDEDPRYIEGLRRETNAEIIKAFRVTPDFDSTIISTFDVESVLLDAFSSEGYGGTGKALDWETANSVSRSVPKLYLAGGLTPLNVAAAVEMVDPFAVDVASGVELSPGRKDPEKLEAFIANAKSR